MLLDDAPADGLGRTPWDAPHPIVLDTSAALELGYEPVGDYAATVADEVDWLVAAARGGREARSSCRHRTTSTSGRSSTTRPRTADSGSVSCRE